MRKKPEEKTGQSIDLMKYEVLHPALVHKIIQHIPQSKLSLVDFGCGDASSAFHLTSLFLEMGVRIDNLGLVDSDPNFPKMAMSRLVRMSNLGLNIQAVQSCDRSTYFGFLQTCTEKYDAALFQLVLHHLQSLDVLTYLMYAAHEAVKLNGYIFTITFTMQFLRYLADYYPKKFTATEYSEDFVRGTYRFDSGGSQLVHNFNLRLVCSVLLSQGLDFVENIPVHVNKVYDEKPLYRDLVQHGIPMFNLLVMKKREDFFVSTSKGTVKSVRRYHENWIEVIFSNGEFVIVPEFKDWNKVKSGELFIVLENRHPTLANGTIFNYWVVQRNNTVRTGQIIAQEKK